MQGEIERERERVDKRYDDAMQEKKRKTTRYAKMSQRSRSYRAPFPHSGARLAH